MPEPTTHDAIRACRSFILSALIETMEERSRSDDWIANERTTVAVAANEWATAHGFERRVTVDDIERIEGNAMGHIDYARKLTLYAAEFIIAPRRLDARMSEHLHSTFVPGCYRCELSRDEIRETEWQYFSEALAWYPTGHALTGAQSFSVIEALRQALQDGRVTPADLGIDVPQVGAELAVAAATLAAWVEDNVHPGTRQSFAEAPALVAAVRAPLDKLFAAGWAVTDP